MISNRFHLSKALVVGVVGVVRCQPLPEAQHTLVELVWHGKRGRACFLGFDTDWRLDQRQARHRGFDEVCELGLGLHMAS